MALGEFVKRAREVHGDKYIYTDVVYRKAKENVDIICPIHGVFKQKPDKHLHGHGCPKCAVNASACEEEIYGYLASIVGGGGSVISRDKTVLKPLELDIYLPKYKFAVEYDGLVWHSEKFGKGRDYHLGKTELCGRQGIRLVHIFEDEYLNHKEIVLSKLRHILGKNSGLGKVYARKCAIKEITSDEARGFLEENSIQNHCDADVFLGCFHGDALAGVMSFKQDGNETGKWEFSRFATDISKRCIGVGGKLFKYFVDAYCPIYVKSFADRRWAVDSWDNVYRMLGFKLTDVLEPDYMYVNGLAREDKSDFRKEALLEKYPDAGLTEDMDEREMARKLGFYRIWDCGMLKYEWVNGNP